jgi:hypothetical protein
MEVSEVTVTDLTALLDYETYVSETIQLHRPYRVCPADILADLSYTQDCSSHLMPKPGFQRLDEESHLELCGPTLPDAESDDGESRLFGADDHALSVTDPTEAAIKKVRWQMPANFGGTFTKRRRSLCLSCICLSVVLVGVISLIAFLSPNPEFPSLASRSSDSAWMWTLEHLETGVRLVHFEDQRQAAGVTVIQGWFEEKHEFTVWQKADEPSVTVEEHLPEVRHNCYLDQLPATGDPRGLPGPGGGYHLDDQVAFIFTQPIPVSLPDTLFAWPTADTCTVKTAPIDDYGAHPPPVEPDGSSNAGEHFVVGTVEDAEVIELQQVQVGGLDALVDRERLFYHMHRTQFDVQQNILVSVEPESNASQGVTWPFRGHAAPSTLLSTCAHLRTVTYNGLYEACVAMITCGERHTVRPPQGGVDHLLMCQHANTERPCQCLHEMVGNLMLISRNGCGLCLKSEPNTESCRCWAHARILALVAQYSPCMHLAHGPQLIDTAQQQRQRYICGQHEVCQTHITSHCTNTAHFCTVAPQGPRYQCFSTAYDYLIKYSKSGTVVVV